MKSIITKGKDKPKKEFENNLVYRIHCNNCPATYVGQTKRQLVTRIHLEKQPVNKKKDTQNLNHIYTHLLQTYKRK